MNLKKLSEKTGIPQSDLNNLRDALNKMKADGLFDTPAMKEFEARQKLLRESPYKSIFGDVLIPLSEWEISVGFISFFDEMPEKGRKIVVRAHPNRACNDAIFHYVGKYIDNDMINCSYDGQTRIVIIPIILTGTMKNMLKK